MTEVEKLKKAYLDTGIEKLKRVNAMTEIQELKMELVERDLFIENLLKELKEAYNSIEAIKDEVISITLDFKHIVESLKK